MESLARWSGLTRLRSLTLSGSDVRPAGMRALLQSPHARALKELSLREGRLDGQAMAEFESAQPGLRLELLDLGENVLRDGGAESIATAPCLGELKVLRLDRCEIRRADARALVEKAVFLGELRQLDVGYNHFGSAGLAALLAREPRHLHTLVMRDNDLHDRAAELMAQSPATDALLDIDLRNNGLGNAAAQALSESTHLRGLLVLRFGNNPVYESAASALAASPLGRRLSVLELDKVPPHLR
jgi:Ran GTPase-activating protein (RanGAP) involved in mRNA processing and transport